LPLKVISTGGGIILATCQSLLFNIAQMWYG